jgi:hypothetical protein
VLKYPSVLMLMIFSCQNGKRLSLNILIANFLNLSISENHVLKHPSLTADFNEPYLLQPRRLMNPYEQCWSGKKWKWCHKIRESQTPVEIGERQHLLRVELAKGYCSHPEASNDTCRKIIRSHTVHRNGGLSAIAEDGHVISIKTAFEYLVKNKGEVVPRRIGNKDASTFMGFCETHDSEMFRPIETGKPIVDKEMAFLLSFRAISYELFTKRAAARCMELELTSDQGCSFEKQCQIQQDLHVRHQGQDRGLASVTEWKRGYDNAFLQRNKDRFHFYAVLFDEVLPVVACGAFFPEFDFNSFPLQRVAHGNSPFQHIAFNLTVLDGKSIGVLGWMEEVSDPAEQLAKSLASLPANARANAMAVMALEFLENTYLRPSWWQSLPQHTKELAIARIKSGIGLNDEDRSSKCLSDLSLNLAEGTVVQELFG